MSVPYKIWPKFTGRIISAGSGSVVSNTTVVANTTAILSGMSPAVLLYSLPAGFNYVGLKITANFSNVVINNTGAAIDFQYGCGFCLSKDTLPPTPGYNDRALGIWFGDTYVGTNWCWWGGNHYGSQHQIAPANIGAGTHSFTQEIEVLNVSSGNFQVKGTITFTAGPKAGSTYTGTYWMGVPYSPDTTQSYRLYVYPLSVAFWVAGNSATCERVVITSPNLAEEDPYVDFEVSRTDSKPFSRFVTFTNISEDTEASYSWGFGDGAVATTFNAEHEYLAFGTYDVSLSMAVPGFDPVVTTKQVVVLPFAPWDNEAEYFIQQYKDSVSASAFVNQHGVRMQDLATTVAATSLASLNIEAAEGEQLNNIGKTVDAKRGSLSDADYRTWISFIQRVNAAGGEPEIIIAYLREFFGADFESLLFDEGNAAVNLQLITGTVTDEKVEEAVVELRRIVPAAVEVRLFHSEGDVFAVADEGTVVTSGAGFSEEDTETPYTDRTTGGQFIDPITI